MSGIDGWLTMADAAMRYGVKRDRLRRASLQGRLATVKIGSGATSAIVVRPEEVERYLRETRRGRPAKVRER